MLKFFTRLAIILIFALSVVAGVSVAAYYFLPTAPTSSDSTVANGATLEDDTYNILLCGVDKKRENADTIVVASFDTKNKTLKLLSVPRDTMSNVDRSIQKINASYSVDHKGNIEQTIREVEMVTALPIDRYAITTFDGFEKAIDAIGGVKMYVPMDLEYSDPYQDLEIKLKEGEQVLDGKHALQFVRFRSGYATGDIGRIGAQQLFFSALADTFLDSKIVTKIPALSKVVSENMETDLTISEMVWFFKQAQGMSKDSIEMFILPGTADYYDGLSYYIPSESGIIELINSKFIKGSKRISPEDLDLVPIASSTVDTSNEANTYGEDIENGYDNNGSYIGSGQGGSTYEGNSGAYVPPTEQSTGNDYRDTTTETVPGRPVVDDNNATVVPNPGNGGGSSGDSGNAGGSGNTGIVQ